jgi:hypothetical protein
MKSKGFEQKSKNLFLNVVSAVVLLLLNDQEIFVNSFLADEKGNYAFPPCFSVESTVFSILL